MILYWDEEKNRSRHHLHADHIDDSHVQEYPEEHCHRDIRQYFGTHYGQPCGIDKQQTVTTLREIETSRSNIGEFHTKNGFQRG